MGEAERAGVDVPIELRRASQKFLDLGFEERQRVLHSLGLGRYGILLGRLRASESNLIVVMGFFGQPGRVKFPNLRGADLAGLVLDGANLIRADLSVANLSGCRLRRADLLFARLTETDVRGADLTGATLHETSWAGAQVEGCRFGTGYGLRPDQRHELIDRGGLFSDVMGDNG